MSKYELSLLSDYVPSWTVVDAVRELFQNAIDQQTLDPNNYMNFSFSDGTLSISSALSELPIRSLLLGATTKATNSATIGQFGEGYKVASLVLSRMGKLVQVFNNRAGTLWLPKLEYVEKYDDTLLVFNVHELELNQIKDDTLNFVISGISREEWKAIVESNLWLQEPTASIKTKLGYILLDERYKGKVFVNGLFVCNHAPYQLGYNFNPQVLKLDRDRKIADPFYLEWHASNMWSTTTGYEDKIAELAAMGAGDVRHVTSHLVNNGIANRALEKFVEAHGPRAVPVSNQDEAKAVPKGYDAVVVNDKHKELIVSSHNYSKPIERVKELSNKERLELWYERYRPDLSMKAKREFNKIVKGM